MVKRRAAWEEAAAAITGKAYSWNETEALQYLLQSEFENDEYTEISLEISVYKISLCQAIQTVSEHRAGTGCRPSPACYVDLELNSVKHFSTPGQTNFEFTTERHCEWNPSSQDSLEEALEGILSGFSDRISRRIEKSEIGSYIAERMREKDPEWTNFYGALPDGSHRKDWEKLLRSAGYKL